MIFPPGQSSTGWIALGLSVVAVITFFAADSLGAAWSMFANVACAGSTLLAFILAAYAHVERHGRLEAARSALFVAVSLIVYYMVTSLI